MKSKMLQTKRVFGVSKLTAEGGGPTGCGVVYEMGANDQFTVLYNFMGLADGGDPKAGVLRDSAGNLYGTTYFGGVGDGEEGVGVVYKVSAPGQETVLYAFTGHSDGGNPYGGVISDSDGNLYGTTYDGGDGIAQELDGGGVVFKLNASGEETVLYTFDSVDGGSRPYTGMIRDTVGNLYGTTSSGGAANQGAVFELPGAAAP